MHFFKSIVKKIKKTIFTKQNFAVLALLISFYYFSKSSRHGIPSIKLNYFLMALSRNYISEVYLSGPTIKFKGSNSNWYQSDRTMLSESRMNKLMINSPSVSFSRSESILSTLNRSSLFIYGIAFLVLIQTLRFLREFQYRSLKKDDKLLSSSIKFKDVCGHETAKNELKQIIDFLNAPERFMNIGARIRKGMLLYGPPGTGKTFLAKVKIKVFS